MAEALRQLTIQLLDWIAAQPRTYSQVMDAWRTTCPRLSVWEDALADDLVEIHCVGRQSEARVALTPRGHDMLRKPLAGDQPEHSSAD